MDLHLEGKIAVVTGATKGIGLAVTRTLLQEGAHVVASSRTRSPEFDALAHDPANTGSLRHVAADLADPAAPAEIIARALERFGGLDILVNNAGGPPPGTKLPRFGFLDLTDDAWHAMRDFNLLSAVRACRAAIPLSIERGGGSIINITSGHARQPSAINVHYGAADIIAAHTGADRATLMTTTAPQMMALATGRLAEPQEIADAVVLLASPRSGSTTGADLVVDSGCLKAS